MFDNLSLARSEFIKSENGYDLIITDYTMPKMNGLELSKKMLKQKKDTRIMLVSGLGMLINNEELENVGIKKQLSKPIDFNELLVAIRRLLDE